MKEQNILVTGGAGFIGSNFIEYFIEKYPKYKIINLDLLTYAGNLENLKDVESNPNYTFIHGDICDEVLVRNIFTTYKVSSVIHFAAESHVDNSIDSPNVFVKTNVLGTQNLLEIARQYWAQNNMLKTNRFHHISTDEVYGSLGEDGLFSESTPYAPNSPYSASKASSDMLVRAYHHTYNMNTIVTNCSNNYGPKQHDEKLIPTIIRNALKGNPIPIYGDGKNIRDWLYVLDHVRGIDIAFHSQKSGEIYNIGGGNEKTNIEIANTICGILDILSPRVDKASYLAQIQYVKDRAGHDRRYAIDASKIQTELGWKAEMSFKNGLENTIRYYIEKYTFLNG